MLMIMHVELSPWSVLAAVPYVWEAVRNPMAQSAAFRVKRQLQTYQSKPHGAHVRRSIADRDRALPGGTGQSRAAAAALRYTPAGCEAKPHLNPISRRQLRWNVGECDRKHIRLTMAEEQYVEFVRTRKTKFLLNDKEVDAKLLQPGDKVTVEATKEANGDLVALQIINGGKKPAAAAATSTTPAKTDQP